MWANNETGVISPVRQIAEICRERGLLFHCDASQAVSKIPIGVDSLAFDYVTLSGHKMGGPKGVGALYVRRGSPFSSYLLGGHQESGRRGGTENVPLIVGFGCAAEIAINEMPARSGRIRELRDDLESGVLATVPNVHVNGGAVDRLPNTSNLHFEGVDANALLLLLDQSGVCVSAGSACLADSDEPSHVISAMNPGGLAAKQSIRYSLGSGTTSDDVRYAIRAVEACVRNLRPSGTPL